MWSIRLAQSLYLWRCTMSSPAIICVNATCWKVWCFFRASRNFQMFGWQQPTYEWKPLCQPSLLLVRDSSWTVFHHLCNFPGDRCPVLYGIHTVKMKEAAFDFKIREYSQKYVTWYNLEVKRHKVYNVCYVLSTIRDICTQIKTHHRSSGFRTVHLTTQRPTFVVIYFQWNVITLLTKFFNALSRVYLNRYFCI